VHIYRDDDEYLARRQGEMRWAAQLGHALEHKQLVLYQQRILPLDGHAQSAPYCSEFLVRMNAPDGDVILPGAFIPAAERYNMMPGLDRWVIRSVFELLALEREQGNAAARRIAFINLSGVSLNDESMVPFIRARLREGKVDPARVCFELTETAAITDMPAAIEFIRAIRADGCLFALDDFGTGFSSFSYLRTIPADFIKIDGAFIRDILSDPMSAAIVESIAQIARVAGLRTIAEHVETDALIDRLRAIGIDYAQGYAIEPPRAFRGANAEQ
jgi:EAL domain-containing protein (putative c-di-GMP-specific phosphodiesterase class I)